MTRIAGLTGATLPTAPTVCHDCIWWQTRTGRSIDKRRWIRGTEEEWGAWGTVYYDDDGRLLGSMQYGPSDLFPRDFLADLGFITVRMQGRVELVRLELGGLVPVVEGKREHVLRVVREAFAPAPAPQRP